jgi:hypothetical protein
MNTKKTKAKKTARRLTPGASVAMITTVDMAVVGIDIEGGKEKAVKDKNSDDRSDGLT